MNWYPESKPDCARGEQGLSNELWVTVWFLAMNSKTILSPGLALTFEGVNVSPPSPTFTLIVAPVPEGRGVAALLAEGVAGAGAEAEAEADADADGAADEASGAEPPVAADLKVAKRSPGLTANTIPLPEQWFPCLQ